MALQYGHCSALHKKCDFKVILMLYDKENPTIEFIEPVAKKQYNTRQTSHFTGAAVM